MQFRQFEVSYLSVKLKRAKVSCHDEVHLEVCQGARVLKQTGCEDFADSGVIYGNSNLITVIDRRDCYL